MSRAQTNAFLAICVKSSRHRRPVEGGGNLANAPKSFSRMGMRLFTEAFSRLPEFCGGTPHDSDGVFPAGKQQRLARALPG